MCIVVPFWKGCNESPCYNRRLTTTCILFTRFILDSLALTRSRVFFSAAAPPFIAHPVSPSLRAVLFHLSTGVSQSVCGRRLLLLHLSSIPTASIRSSFSSVVHSSLYLVSRTSLLILLFPPNQPDVDPEAIPNLHHIASQLILVSDGLIRQCWSNCLVSR